MNGHNLPEPTIIDVLVLVSQDIPNRYDRMPWRQDKRSLDPKAELWRPQK